TRLSGSVSCLSSCRTAERAGAPRFIHAGNRLVLAFNHLPNAVCSPPVCGTRPRPHGGSQMLVITRREGEEGVIGDPAIPIGVVRIASIKGDRVRVAFDFPRAIDVHRREVAEQILAGGNATPAAAGAPSANGHAVAAAPAT